MGTKLILFAVVLFGTLWVLGYGPEDLQRAAGRLSAASAGAIAPPDGAGDWG